MSKSVSMFDAPRRAFVHYDDAPVLDCSVEPSMTVQSEAAKCDINNIVARALKDGFVEHVRASGFDWMSEPGLDVSQVTDYQSAMNFVRAAEGKFMELPAKIRNRFHNNPQEFLEWANNPENRDEARYLGLLEPEATPPAPPAEQRPVGPSVASDEATKGSKGA